MDITRRPLPHQPQRYMSVSKRRSGTNSGALTVTSQSHISHNQVCSSLIAISYPMSMQRDNTSDTVNTATKTSTINNTNSLQFLASPPLSAIYMLYFIFDVTKTINTLNSVYRLGVL